MKKSALDFEKIGLGVFLLLCLLGLLQVGKYCTLGLANMALTALTLEALMLLLAWGAFQGRMPFLLLGVPIFDRTTDPISLTYAGRRYVEAAQRMMEIDRNLRAELAESAAQVDCILVCAEEPAFEAALAEWGGDVPVEYGV